MLYYVLEEEAWNCPKHPSKRRRNGVCPTCLRDRLVSLCPVCATARPCACVDSPVSRVPNSEPSLRRSRSVAIPFLRSKNTETVPGNGGVKATSFLSVLKRSKTKRSSEPPPATENNAAVGNGFDGNNRIDDFARMVTRSRSVNAMASVFRHGDVSPSPAKGKFWHIPSPMKAFRSSKTPKIAAQDRPPLRRA